jgi:hypothetical protein
VKSSAEAKADDCRPFFQRMYWGLNLFSAVGAAITLFDTGGGGNKAEIASKEKTPPRKVLILLPPPPVSNKVMAAPTAEKFSPC